MEGDGSGRELAPDCRMCSMVAYNEPSRQEPSSTRKKLKVHLGGGQGEIRARSGGGGRRSVSEGVGVHTCS